MPSKLIVFHTVFQTIKIEILPKKNHLDNIKNVWQMMCKSATLKTTNQY